MGMQRYVHVCVLVGYSMDLAYACAKTQAYRHSLEYRQHITRCIGKGIAKGTHNIVVNMLNACLSTGRVVGKGRGIRI
jgi:hypothetical protein